MSHHLKDCLQPTREQIARFNRVHALMASPKEPKVVIPKGYTVGNVSLPLDDRGTRFNRVHFNSQTRG